MAMHNDLIVRGNNLEALPQMNSFEIEELSVVKKSILEVGQSIVILAKQCSEYFTFDNVSRVVQEYWCT